MHIENVGFQACSGFCRSGWGPQISIRNVERKNNFHSGVFFSSISFWVSFCFKLSLSTLEFWDGDVKIAIFQSQAFPSHV